MYNNSETKIVTIYSITHFLVDLACIFMVTAFIIPVLGSRTDWLWCMLTYNFCAFAMQMPVGAVIDRLGRPWLFASSGCLMIAVSYVAALSAPYGAVSAQKIDGTVSILMPILACLIAGIGNSCFHAGGGVSVLGVSQRKAALSGIYVSTGAFGVYLAPKLASAGGLVYRWSALAAITIMLISSAILFYGHRKNTYTQTLLQATQSDSPDPSREHKSDIQSGISGSGINDASYRGKTGGKAVLFTAAAFLFLTVCIRSYAGTVMKFSWKSVPVLGLLFTAGIVFGKMFGGILGDRFGWSKVSVGSLVVSAGLFFMAAELPAAGIIGVFLFNMTMPITLTALANIFDKNHGFAFGLTTMALFLGTLPSMLGEGTGAEDVRWVIPVIVISSAVILGMALMCYTKLENRKRAGDDG